ncbi:MAG: hypothetical protein JXR14_11360 [Paracoccaceae bacterium]
MSMTDTPETKRSAIAGLLGFALGAVALIIVLVQHYGGPFTPQPEIGVTIGEIAADIKQSAIAKVTGTPLPPPEPAPDHVDYDRILKVIGAVGGACAVIAGLVGLIRREDRLPATYAVGLGIGTIAFQYLTWVILLICGVVLLVSILNNFAGIFDSWG